MFFKKKISDDEVLTALSNVHDPDLHRDIVSLGFVKNLKIGSDSVRFDLELTTPACPVKDQLKEQCVEKLRALGLSQIDIQMTSQVRRTAPQGNKISLPGVRNVVAIASGKGGVGKSTVAINLTAALSRSGAKVGLLDADLYGPSIPLMMGLKGQDVKALGDIMEPMDRDGIKLMSMGFLVPEDQAVVWRGPMVHGALVQFLQKVNWGELDYLLIDMPPGTGDAQLSISQSAPLSGAIIVTTPQEVSLLDARRGLLMFQNVHVPILGIIENMSGFVCPHCEEVSHIFSQGGGKRFSEERGVPFLGMIPISPEVTQSCDGGTPIVFQKPECEVSRSYIRAAGEMAAQLSILQAQSSGQFRPLSLEWV